MKKAIGTAVQIKNLAFTGAPSSKYVVYATACVYRELYGEITSRKNIVWITISFEIKFSYLKCVAKLCRYADFKAVMPILKLF